MSYKYELHCHTGTVSMCGKVEPKRIVELYKQHGYSGIVLTDHYSELTFYNHHLFNPAKDMDFYLSAYRELKEYCKDDEVFTVLLGVELRRYAHTADFLIYGIDEKFLLECGNMMAWSDQRIFDEVHKAGGLVFMAHPFRWYIRDRNEKTIDGIEVFNGKNSPERNKKAHEWAQKTGKLVSSGSDFHKECDVAKGGIETETKINTNADLLSVLKSRNFKLIENY